MGTKNKKKFYKLNRNINCIPEGVYRLYEQNREQSVFSVSKNVFFILIGNISKSVTEVSRETKKTSEKDFLDNYYKLLKNQPNNPAFDPHLPFTACMINPTVAREMH